ncbi:hypothetical protein KM427_02040 [Nocardioides sp. LMS-CY]|uniref:Uncharacterized protein n=1 Tax=Nocardioides soli TaxID=1036020 RepID=A0A7W4VV91_9ACTN|nr:MULTISPECIES: hypothetical protein [Nocardioides]MBB3042382.1 hypothetical protein [Nocardioides soli]QWF22550.1 hypothetical protein KM427_02040 [Nocardioides sp. LMS-CY]
MSDEATEVLRALWSADEATEAARELDESTPAKVCKRMRGVTFDGMAPPGTDLREAWRDLLLREGKYDGTGGTIRDLVLGPPPR